MKNMPIFILLAFSSLPALAAEKPAIAPHHDQLTIDSKRFTIDIAETPAQQEHGLMGRMHLKRHYGMLFILPEEKDIRMWMKNTPSPLDMLFIDKSGTIVYVAHNTVPESLEMIHAGEPVKAVLEIAGGTAAADGIKVGDKVMHRYFKP